MSPICRTTDLSHTPGKGDCWPFVHYLGVLQLCPGEGGMFILRPMNSHRQPSCFRHLSLPLTTCCCLTQLFPPLSAANSPEERGNGNSGRLASVWMGNVGLGVKKARPGSEAFLLVLMSFGSEHRVAEVWSHFMSTQNVELPSSQLPYPSSKGLAFTPPLMQANRSREGSGECFLHSG